MEMEQVILTHGAAERFPMSIMYFMMERNRDSISAEAAVLRLTTMPITERLPQARIRMPLC